MDRLECAFFKHLFLVFLLYFERNGRLETHKQNGALKFNQQLSDFKEPAPGGWKKMRVNVPRRESSTKFNCLQWPFVNRFFMPL